jgi:hypothetical protein
MIDRPTVLQHCVKGSEKRRWMRALAKLLQVMEDRDVLVTDRERESYKLVREQLKQEYKYERLTWPLERQAIHQGPQAWGKAPRCAE